MYKKLLCTTALAAWISYAHAQQMNVQKLDSLFDILQTKNKAMVSVALAKNGKVLYTKATGIISPEPDPVAATPQSRYRVGSITKTFTATLIMQLVEEGKLELTTPLSKFFPTIPNAANINVRLMLGHRSGIHNFTDDPAYLTYMLQPKTARQMVDIIAATKPDFEPNQKTSYSNSNYVLLGYMVEKITGKSYAENIAARIVKKAGLKETYAGKKADIRQKEAISFAYKDGWKPMPETDLSIPAGAGSVVSTPTDLTRFIEALFNGKLVSAKSLDEMKTTTEGIGLGLFQVPFEWRKGYGHNGSIDGFQSNLFYFPDDSLAAAICTNGSSYAVNSMMIALLSAYYKIPFTVPQFSEYKLDAAALKQYTGTYTSAQLPFLITVKNDSTRLTAQATGQPMFELEPSGKHQFRFDKAGIVMDFNPERNEFILRQNGGNFIFKREY